MNLEFKENDMPEAEVITEKNTKKKNQLFEKNKTNKLILVFVILIFIVNSLILADSIHTKIATYNALGRVVAADNANDGKAEKQGNLGNFNVVSKNNSLRQNKTGDYTLTVDLKFVNYGEEGHSFSDAVQLTAYQNNKEVKSPDNEISLFGEETEAENQKDESDIKVKNGKAADIFLSFDIKDPNKDVEIVMVSGDHEFTYTVQLSKSNIQTGETTAQQQKTQAESGNSDEIIE